VREFGWIVFAIAIVRIKFNACTTQSRTFGQSRWLHLDEVFPLLKLDKATARDDEKGVRHFLSELDQRLRKTTGEGGSGEAARMEREPCGIALERSERAARRWSNVDGIIPLSRGSLSIAVKRKSSLKLLRDAGIESVAGDVRQVVAESQPMGGPCGPLAMLIGGRPYWSVCTCSNCALRPLLRYGISSRFLHDSLQTATTYVSVWRSTHVQ